MGSVMGRRPPMNTVSVVRRPGQLVRLRLTGLAEDALLEIHVDEVGPGKAVKLCLASAAPWGVKLDPPKPQPEPAETDGDE